MLEDFALVMPMVRTFFPLRTVWYSRERFSEKKIPDLSGKVAVVTGANGGIGYEIVLALARHGCRVYCACRSEKRALAAMERVRAELGASVDLHFLRLDLSNLRETAAAAEQLRTLESRIDILINNAGATFPEFELSVDGIELTYATNHLGPLLFTQRLLPTLQTTGTVAEPARIVFISSDLHAFTAAEELPCTMDVVNCRRSYRGQYSYSDSKLASILTAKKMAQQLTTAAEKETGQPQPTVLVNAVHPGLHPTDIVCTQPNALSWFFYQLFYLAVLLLGQSLSDCALSPLYAATSETVREERYNGEYFIAYGLKSWPSEASEDEQLRDDLWNFSTRLINGKLDAS